MDDSGKIVPLHEVILEVGGPPDECGVCLAIYGDDLDPDEITRLLGVPPTDSQRKGEPRKPGSRPARIGAWFLERRGTAPVTPAELTEAVLNGVPSDPERWRGIQQRFDVQLRYGVHFSGWNKGFDLQRDIIARVNVIGASLGFDLYAYGEEAIT